MLPLQRVDILHADCDARRGLVLRDANKFRFWRDVNGREIETRTLRSLNLSGLFFQLFGRFEKPFRERAVDEVKAVLSDAVLDDPLYRLCRGAEEKYTMP